MITLAKYAAEMHTYSTLIGLALTYVGDIAQIDTILSMLHNTREVLLLLLLCTFLANFASVSSDVIKQ